MTGATADGQHIDLVELLHRSDLPAVDRCRVYDAIVTSMIESATPDRESVLLLIDFAPGRIDIDEYRERDLSSRTWRRWGDVAEMPTGLPIPIGTLIGRPLPMSSDRRTRTTRPVK